MIGLRFESVCSPAEEGKLKGDDQLIALFGDAAFKKGGFKVGDDE